MDAQCQISLPGDKTITVPKRPISEEIHRENVTFSFKIGIESIVIKIGAEKLIAVASANGM